MKEPKLISKHVVEVPAPLVQEGFDYYFKTDKKPSNIEGKYLFFSADRKELIKIVIEEFENHGFVLAKINTPERRIGDEDVLCLYYIDDSRKHELAERHRNNPKVNYRYWKSDKDTREGKYSKQFLDDLKKQMGPKQ